MTNYTQKALELKKNAELEAIIKNELKLACKAKQSKAALVKIILQAQEMNAPVIEQSEPAPSTFNEVAAKQTDKQVEAIKEMPLKIEAALSLQSFKVPALTAYAETVVNQASEYNTANGKILETALKNFKKLGKPNTAQRNALIDAILNVFPMFNESATTPATEAPAPAEPEKKATAEFYTTADESFDLAGLELKRSLLEIRSTNGENLYHVELFNSKPKDAVALLESYIHNGHPAWNREEWLKIISNTEVIENMIQLPALKSEAKTQRGIENKVAFDGVSAFLEKAAKSPKKKATRAKSDRTVWEAIGEVKPVAADSNNHKLLKMLAEARYTIAQINDPAIAGFQRSKTWETYIKYDIIRLGYTVRVSPEGIYSLFSADDKQITSADQIALKAPAEKKAPAAPVKAPVPAPTAKAPDAALPARPGRKSKAAKTHAVAAAS